MYAFKSFRCLILAVLAGGCFGFNSETAANAVEASLDILSRNGDWLTSAWAGDVYAEHAPWYWFSATGSYSYCLAGEGKNIWFYNGIEGWSLMGSETFPWAYFDKTSGWYYRQPAKYIWGAREQGWFVLDDVFDWLLPRVHLAINFAGERYGAAADEIAADAFPYQMDLSAGQWVVNGSWNWTSGFFPASLLQLYGWTGDQQILENVIPRLDALEEQKTNTSTHDVGFMIGTPFILAHQLTGDSDYRDIALTGAASLASRFHPSIGSIDAWDWGEWSGIHDTIVDCMMNLELLLWASRQPGGDAAWYDMAVSHADLTAQELIREDGSVTHIVAFDRRRGEVLFKRDFGGSSVDGAVFARGQAWAIYGYSVLYRETGEPRFYETVLTLLDYWLDHTGPDFVPTFELSGVFPPEQTVPDTSGTALIASALLDLAECAPIDDRPWLDWQARQLLETLISPSYLGDGTGNGILYHQTNDFSTATKVDTAISYGDYYWLQAMIRFTSRH